LVLSSKAASSASSGGEPFLPHLLLGFKHRPVIVRYDAHEQRPQLRPANQDILRALHVAADHYQHQLHFLRIVELRQPTISLLQFCSNLPPWAGRSPGRRAGPGPLWPGLPGGEPRELSERRLREAQ
jgi:hypothetical protein